MAKGNKTGKGGFGDNPQNINRDGAPKRGESWKEIIDRIGSMTPKEAADHAKAIAGKLKTIGDGMTLKEAVVIRGYASLLFEPTPGMMNVYMDRTDGKVQDRVDITTKGEKLNEITAEQAESRLAEIYERLKERAKQNAK